jgi:phosphatidylserine/phosphatidylglycerophosphate/cardiolipin synthase-like enzyme
MSLKLVVYENGDHTFLIWFPVDGKPIANCLGFAIEKTTVDSNDQTTCLLPNYVDFGGYNHVLPPAGQEWERPFQRFLWWDYHVKVGQKVTYSVIPVLGDSQGQNLRIDKKSASAPSVAIKISGQYTKSVSAYFNKGIIAAQWVARELAQQKNFEEQGQKKTMTAVLNETGNGLRDALGGLLKKRIIEALQGVIQQGGTIYAALYELNDPELLECLKQLGKHANIILANGAFKTGAPDENALIRDTIRSWGTVKVHDRMVSSGHFAHNKFVVFCDSNDSPQTVLTGSTNWTKTGLCTQANNALFIQDEEVAIAYRAQWQRLIDAQNGFPPELIKSNSDPKKFHIDEIDLSVWFTPTSHQQDMSYARSLIKNAENGILFLFFNPGQFSPHDEHSTLLQTVVECAQVSSNLYVRGVVNQKISGLTDDDGAPVNDASSNNDEKGAPHDPTLSVPVVLYQGSAPPVRAPANVLVPAAIKTNFAGWESELLSMGVMVHSKVVVLDPFGEKPVVMAGSHNLGPKASRANDDNLVILEGEGARAVAIAYALNIIAIYQEYRWRNYVATHRANAPWQGLVRSDKWQIGHLANTADCQFWMAGPTTDK